MRSCYSLAVLLWGIVGQRPNASVRRIVFAACVAGGLSMMLSGCSDALDEFFGPAEHIVPASYAGLREDPAAVIGLYFEAQGSGDAEVLCELASTSTDSAAMMRWCIASALDCQRPAADRAQLAAVEVNHDVVDSLTFPTTGELVAVPYRALTWPQGEPWTHQGGDGPDGIALFLDYDNGWRVEPYGFILPACPD